MILKVHHDPESHKTAAKKLFKKGLLKTRGIAELFLSDLYEDDLNQSIQFLKSGSAQGNTRCDLQLYRIYLQNKSFKNHTLGYKHLIKADSVLFLRRTTFRSKPLLSTNSNR